MEQFLESTEVWEFTVYYIRKYTYSSLWLVKYNPPPSSIFQQFFDVYRMQMQSMHHDKIEVQDLQGGFERKGVVGKEKSYRD